MTPVITHPERNGLLAAARGVIASWVEQGARVQLTAQSLTGGFGRRAQDFSRELLDRGWCTWSPVTGTIASGARR